MESESLSPELKRADELYAQMAWGQVYTVLREADRQSPLELRDLWRLVWCAVLSGHEPDALAIQERIYQQELERNPAAAGRAAFWLGFRLLHLGATSKSSAWLARAQRVLERLGGDDVLAGYLELPQIRVAFMSGQFDAALAASERAIALGERFADPDLVAFARNNRGRTLIAVGQVETGLKLIDEAMLDATAGDLSPTVTGLVYCSAITTCQSVYEVSRVREWTASLSDWCRAQPEMTTFTGECLLSRAEVMELSGEWPAALEEARRAVEDLTKNYGPLMAGAGIYRQGEIHRLRGELTLAEESYRRASEVGRDPQPGLALLWLSQDKVEAAVQALRRAVAEAKSDLSRAKLLPAQVEALVRAGACDEAAAAATELTRIAGTFASELLLAHAARARGAVELLRGEAASALGLLRQAFETWQRLNAPYLAAQARIQLACAYQVLGDEQGATFELEGARSSLVRLGAALDVAVVDALKARASSPSHASGLTARELGVLRLVAAGKTNKLIARELCLAEKTVDRHVSNILNKLSVPSRAAATAFAYENKLL